MDIQIKKCEVCGSKHKVYFNKRVKKLLCSKHRSQLYYYDKFLDNSPHSKYDKNEIILKENYAIMITRNSKYKKTNEYKIDFEDIEKIKDIRWRSDKKGYAFNNSKKNIFIHNLILKPPKGYFIDHINRDPTDNRKQNLRIVTHRENNINVERTDTGEVKGVGFLKNKNKWRARIWDFGKEINLYYGDSFDEAVYQRIKAESIYYKKYSINYNEIKKGIYLKYYSKEKNKNIELFFKI